MLTKAKLAEYNQRGELVPIGTKLITVQLGECEIYAHNKGRGNNYIYECYNSQRRMSYDKEFKLTIDNAYTSLIDPTPSSVNSPFTMEELECIETLSGINSDKLSLCKSINAKANHLLSAPSEWPQMMEVSEGGIIWQNKKVIGMFNGLYIVESGKVGNLFTYKHASPIPKEKTLADLKEGDEIWCKVTNGKRITFGKSYTLLRDVNGDLDFYDDDKLRRYWPLDEAADDFQLTPITREQIEAAEAAEIKAVKDKYELMKKEVKGE